MGASCGGDDRFGDGRDELILSNAKNLVEPAEIPDLGGDGEARKRAEVTGGARPQAP
jgi:hypothetical protein